VLRRSDKIISKPFYPTPKLIFVEEIISLDAGVAEERYNYSENIYLINELRRSVMFIEIIIPPKKSSGGAAYYSYNTPISRRSGILPFGEGKINRNLPPKT